MTEAVKTKQPTLKAIAQKAGVSTSAVSQILNNRPVNFCSEEKKTLVRKVAREMNYKPSFGYRVMCGMATNTVAIIHSLPYYCREEHIQKLQIGLMDYFELHNYSIYICKMTESADANLDKIADLIQRGCSSFIFIGMPVGVETLTTAIEKRGIPYVGFGCPLRRSINAEGSCALEEYIAYLQRQGRQEFRLLCRSVSGRLNGLYRSFPQSDPEKLRQQYNRPIDMTEDYFRDDIMDKVYRHGYRFTAALMAAEPQIEALIYENDHLMLGGVRYLQEQGRVIGKDILVCGYNYTSAVRMSPLPLSSVDHGMEQVAATIAAKLSDPGDFAIALPCRLIIREYGSDRYDLMSNQEE